MLTPNSLLQNRYLIVRLLGKGGMGAVYEAIDQRLSCVVALKETLVGSNPEARQGFQREAALLANLRHASLPNVMDYFGEDQGQFLVMEFIAGQDLAELLVLRDAPFRESKVVRWANDILKLLEYLHTREPAIIHRDIKPANLKVTTQGEIFLLDFGLAKGAAGQMATIQNDQSVYGYTPLYAPLEQIQSGGTDPRSDIYALGATLYHLLTGVPPVSAPVRYEAAETDQPDPLKPANQLNFQVSPEIAALIQNAMALRRNDRFQNAAEMRVALENAARIIADRKSARQAEQALIDTLPQGAEAESARPLITDKDVQFTVYTPQKIKPEKNYSVLAFAHLSKKRDDAPDDEPDPIAEMKEQAARILGGQIRDYSDTRDASRQAVPRGGQITFVPLVPGIKFSPSSRSFNWRKSVHREEFDMWAERESDGKTLNGSLTVFLGSVVIAEVALKISVDSQATPTAERISPERSQSARRVRQVFASYSPRDEQVVAELAHVAPVFGSRFLIDRTHLEPGEDRIEGLQRLIREADVFQLFWSTNSMRSSETVGEIKYAASLGRPGFILPTYWEEPVPRSPAEGLPPPEIDRLQFYRIYPGAISKAMFDVRTGSDAVIQTKVPREPIGFAGPDHAILLPNTDPNMVEESLGMPRVMPSVDTPTHELPPPDTPTRELLPPGAPTPRELPPLLETIGAPPPSFGNAAAGSAPTFGTVVCSTCGFSNSAGMKFCARCGTSLIRVRETTLPDAPVAAALPPQNFQAPTVPAPTQHLPAPAVAKRRRSVMIPIFAGLAMVLFIVILAPAWFIMNNRATLTANSNSTSNRNANFNVNRRLEPAPDLEFTSLSGEVLRLKDYRGQVVLLNFWATWNSPSKEQVAVLNGLHESLNSKGLAVIGISYDDTADRVRKFQKENLQKYQIGLGGKAVDQQLAARPLPRTYIIDRSGIIRSKLTGVQDRQTLEAAILPLLSEK